MRPKKNSYNEGLSDFELNQLRWVIGTLMNILVSQRTDRKIRPRTKKFLRTILKDFNKELAEKYKTNMQTHAKMFYTDKYIQALEIKDKGKRAEAIERVIKNVNKDGLNSRPISDADAKFLLERKRMSGRGKNSASEYVLNVVLHEKRLFQNFSKSTYWRQKEKGYEGWTEVTDHFGNHLNFNESFAYVMQDIFYLPTEVIRDLLPTLEMHECSNIRNLVNSGTTTTRELETGVRIPPRSARMRTLRDLSGLGAKREN